MKLIPSLRYTFHAEHTLYRVSSNHTDNKYKLTTLEFDVGVEFTFSFPHFRNLQPNFNIGLCSLNYSSM